jgi:hypothetical protein
MALKPLDMADLFQQSALLMHANKLDLFTFLAAPKPLDQVAEKYGYVGWKSEVFLDALTAIGLLKKSAAGYETQPDLKSVLVRTQAGYVGQSIEHERLQWTLWGDLGAVLSAVAPTAQQQERRLNEQSQIVFQQAMHQQAATEIDFVAKHARWSQSKFIVDLAGGHGNYLTSIAAKHPHITGEIWDLPEAEPIAVQSIEKARLQSRISFNVVDLNHVRQKNRTQLTR